MDDMEKNDIIGCLVHLGFWIALLLIMIVCVASIYFFIIPAR